MAHEFSEIRPIGGLNKDAGERQIPVNDYPYAKNIRNAVNAANRGGTLTNVLSNLKIDKYTLPYSNGVFPTGKNKCIGAVEDTKYNTVIFMVWNEFGKHQILRYYRDKVNPSNPYGEVEQIIQFDFGWTKKQRITSLMVVYGNSETGTDDEKTGDLLYWCDPKPRKINLTKANVCEKIKCWDLYLPKTIDGSIWDSFNLTAKDYTGNTLYNINLNKTIFVQKTGTVRIYPVYHGGSFDYTEWDIEIDQILDLTGTTSFQVSGSNFAVNNRSWSAVTFSAGLGTTVIRTTSIAQGLTPSTDGHYDVFTGTISYFTPAGANDRNSIIAAIASQINNDQTNTTLDAEFCDCRLMVCEKVAGTVWALETDNPQLLISAKNWYGADLAYEFFDRCKYPELNAPQALFKKDEAYEPNYVQKKVFQFRLQKRYDDFEESSLGVWSQIPINNLACDGTSSPEYNFIDVDFNDTHIPLATTLVILKQIRFIAREGNATYTTDDKGVRTQTGGKDRAVITLEPCDFLDYDLANNKWVCHFEFYNDIISNAVDDVLAAKLFDNVPLESEAENFENNRIIEGNVLRGYDAPACVNAKAQMEFAEVANQKLVKIKGHIRILTYGLGDSENNPNTGLIPPYLQRNFYNMFPGLNKYPFWEIGGGNDYNLRRGGIFSTGADGVYPFFGGGGFGVGAGGDFGIRDGMQDTFDQRIPEGGFPVYAAGTDYFTVSKQKNVGLTALSNGALDISNGTLTNSIGAYLYPPNSKDLYSEFELLVPANSTYVIRLASHWCSFGVNGEDKLKKGYMYDLSGGRGYQKTSTNVWSFIDPIGIQHKTKEWTVSVGSSDVFIGDFIVADLAPPYDADFDGSYGSFGKSYVGWQMINGYLVCDSNDTGAQNVNSQDFIGVPIEKAIVTFSARGGFVSTSDVYPRFDGVVTSAKTQLSSDLTNDIVLYDFDAGWGETCITDHNGYWFGIGGAAISKAGLALQNDFSFLGNWNFFPIGALQTNKSQANNIWDIRIPNSQLYVGSLSDYYNRTMSSVNYNGYTSATPPLVHCVVAATTASARQNGETIIDGSVIDSVSLSGISGISAIYQNGSTSTSVADGSFSIPCWSDLLTPNIGRFSLSFNPISDDNRIVDSLIIVGDTACNITYTNGQFQLLLITPFDSAATGYNITKHFIANAFLINEANNPSIKAHKRGGNYTYAGRLYDDAGRLCSCFFLFETYVPFITEDIGKYGIENFDGLVYPANTFRYGKPSVKWVLDSTTVFPTWAKTFQLMRVKNSIYGRYLQWVANQVTYLSATKTTSTPEIKTAFQNSDAVAIKISISNILGYYSNNNDSNVGYTYQAGDRVRLIADRSLKNYSSANFASIQGNITDFEVTSYDSATQELIVKPNGFALEIQSGCLFEIFNPKSVETTDEQIFYEVGEVVKVNNGIPETFSGVLTNGDTYWRGRTIIVNDDATKFASAYPVVIEDASVSDFYPSEAQDIGRIGIIDDKFKQVLSPMLMMCSNPFLPGTASNGLSSFEALNEKELDRANGSIKRLLTKNNTVIAVSTERETSNYIQVVTFKQAGSGDGVLAIANQYFGTEYPHAKRLGSDLPASVLINDGVAFGFQSKRGETWKFQGDGELTISEAKMLNYFYQLELDGVSDACAVYDRKHEEYILTVWRNYHKIGIIQNAIPTTGGQNLVLQCSFIEDSALPVIGGEITLQKFDSGKWIDVLVTVVSTGVSGIYSTVTVFVADDILYEVGKAVNLLYTRPETVSWFNGTETDNNQRWLTFYDFTPECYSQMGSETVMFEDGKIWLSGVGVGYNKFFGKQYETKITLVFNQNMELNKTWNALWLSQIQADKKCNWRSDRITNEYSQLSRLNNKGFVPKEKTWYVDFKRDLTDAVTPNPILNGRRLRSSSLTVEMSNNYTGEIILNWAKANYTLSERTSR